MKTAIEQSNKHGVKCLHLCEVFWRKFLAFCGYVYSNHQASLLMINQLKAG